MQGRGLSSAWTLFMNLVFPVALGAGVLSFWSRPERLPPPDSIKLGLAAISIVGIGFWIWFVPFKRVYVNKKTLYISNYFQTISIPVSEIENVAENRWINIHPITIHLRQATPFGRKITFMPKLRFLVWQSHPVVAELKQLAGLEGVR
jgi:hypothetical protein